MGWLRQHSVLVTTGGLLLLSLALVILNSSGGRRVDPLGVVFLELVTPVARVSEFAANRVGDAWESYAGLMGVRQELSWVRGRVRELEREVDHQRRVEDENRRLRALLQLRNELGGSPIAARLTGIGASQLFHTATLNRGTGDGVAEGMAVLAPRGVVGRVVSASPNAARVLLLEDPGSGVDAVVQRTRTRGIVEGAAAGKLKLKFVTPDEELRLGDEIVTSGLDGIFPRGLPLGNVTRIAEDDTGLFQSAELVTAVDFQKLEEVLVMEAPPREVPPEVGEAG